MADLPQSTIFGFLFPLLTGAVISYLVHLIFIKGSKRDTVFATVLIASVIFFIFHELLFANGSWAFRLGSGFGLGLLAGWLGYYTSSWMFKKDFIE